MVLCEQFIFTSSKLDDGGYQVISKSSDITSSLLNELEEYLYPIGIDPSDFIESKSMRVLDNKIAYIHSKNIGVGFDGRPDTMYSHIIVMNKDIFQKLENDSRILNEYYIEKKQVGHLPPLSIDVKQLSPDFECIDIIGIIKFQKCLRSILKHEKIAIINTKNQRLIQSILSLIPPSLRLISFSTMVSQPEIQTKFEIVQIDEQKKSSLKKYVIIDDSEKEQASTKDHTLLDICLNYIIEIIDKKKSVELQQIHKEFEQIPISNVKTKISLIVGHLLLKSNKEYSFKREILEHMLIVISEIPQLPTKYQEQIREFLSPEELERYALEGSGAF